MHHGSRITAVGHYQPARVLTNEELTAMVDTSDEWIRSRVGIRSRRIAGPDEPVLDRPHGGPARGDDLVDPGGFARDRAERGGLDGIGRAGRRAGGGQHAALADDERPAAGERHDGRLHGADGAVGEKGELVRVEVAASAGDDGTRAGRERYEQIKKAATRVKDDPRVQEKAAQAADLAKEKAPVVKDKVAAAASTAADKVTPSSNGDHRSDLEDQLNPDSTALQDNPYPQGNLP